MSIKGIINSIIGGGSALVTGILYFLYKKNKREKENLQAENKAISKTYEGEKIAGDSKDKQTSALNELNNKSDKEVFDEWNKK